MRNRFSYQNTWRLALLGTALATIGLAQMGGRGGMMGSGASANGTSGTNSGTGMSGGMGSGVSGSGMSGTGSGMSGTGSGMNGGMGSGMQGAMAGTGAGMGSLGSGPVIGTDGTAYVVRTTAATAGTQQTWKRELVAINPATGKANWSVQIDGTMVSAPVLAKDGTILLTTSEPPMGLNTIVQPSLVIVAPTATSARIQARVNLDGDMLSAPVMTPDGQTIYITSTDMPDMSSGNQNMSALKRVLYGLYPGTGAVKFTVQLQ